MERNWNGTSSSEKLGGTERNEFQFRVGWNGTERVPKKSERSTTLSAFIPVLSHQEKSNGADSSVTLN